MADTTVENYTTLPQEVNSKQFEVNDENGANGMKTQNGTGLNDDDTDTPEAETSSTITAPRFVFGIRCFVANLALLYFFQFAMIVYLFGVIRTMERRFGLDSRKSGVILSADDVVQISVVTFIGHFGKRASKPRIIGVLALSFAVGGMLLALPHFLYGAQAQSAGSARNFTYGGEPEVMLCDALNDHSAGQCEETASATQTANGAAYVLFILGQMFVGLGYSATSVLGLSYIDENAPKHKSSLYIGELSYPNPGDSVS